MILGPDGRPMMRVLPKTEEAATAGPPKGPAPTPLGPRRVKINDGGLKAEARVSFKNINVGGEGREKFEAAIDAILQRALAVAIRLIELSLLGAQRGVEVTPAVVGCVNDMGTMRRALEAIMARVNAGQDPFPVIQTAREGDIPPVEPQ